MSFLQLKIDTKHL